MTVSTHGGVGVVMPGLQLSASSCGHGEGEMAHGGEGRRAKAGHDDDGCDFFPLASTRRGTGMVLDADYQPHPRPFGTPSRGPFNC